MKRTAQPVYFAIMAVLGLVLLGGCSSPTASPTPTAISATLTATITPTIDTTAVAEASYQAILDNNKTQNAAHFATSAAKRTATFEARPPTAVPTRRPTATPTEEGLGVSVQGILVHHADKRTGLVAVDQIIDIVLAGDINEFRRRIRFTTSSCTHVMALGGPPNCREGEAEGARIEVLPFMGPEGHFLRRDELNEWQGIDAAGLYAVYRVSDQAYSHQDYPAGEYAIVFRTKEPQFNVTLQVENGRILRIDNDFGTPPEIDYERDVEEVILPPPDVKECPGAAPQRVMIGEKARVCTESDDLIVRIEPGLSGNELTGIEPGTNFMIIDGPSCANSWSWWKVELDAGLEGWVAEGGDNIDPYFICPVD